MTNGIGKLILFFILDIWWGPWTPSWSISSIQL
jgi:hypothetical protein